MTKGGWRPGAGRPKGTTGKRRTFAISLSANEVVKLLANFGSVHEAIGKLVADFCKGVPVPAQDVIDRANGIKPAKGPKTQARGSLGANQTPSQASAQQTSDTQTATPLSHAVAGGADISQGDGSSHMAIPGPGSPAKPLQGSEATKPPTTVCGRCQRLNGGRPMRDCPSCASLAQAKRGKHVEF